MAAILLVQFFHRSSSAQTGLSQMERYHPAESSSSFELCDPEVALEQDDLILSMSDLEGYKGAQKCTGYKPEPPRPLCTVQLNSFVKMS